MTLKLNVTAVWQGSDGLPVATLGYTDTDRDGKMGWG